MALQAVGEAFSTVSNMMSAAEQREFKNYEKTQNKKKKLLERQLKAGTISQERYNEAVQRLDDETEAKREENERKQAKRDKALAVFNSLINTAVAVTAALQAGPIIGPILAGIVAALGLSRPPRSLPLRCPGRRRAARSAPSGSRMASGSTPSSRPAAVASSTGPPSSRL